MLPLQYNLSGDLASILSNESRSTNITTKHLPSVISYLMFLHTTIQSYWIRAAASCYLKDRLAQATQGLFSPQKKKNQGLLAYCQFLNNCSSGWSIVYCDQGCQNTLFSTIKYTLQYCISIAHKLIQDCATIIEYFEQYYIFTTLMIETPSMIFD